MNTLTNARTTRSAARVLACAVLVFGLPLALARGQQHGNPPRNSAPHYSAPRNNAPQYRPQYRQAPQAQRGPQYQQPRYQGNNGQGNQNQGGYGANQFRQTYPNQNYGRPGYSPTPAYNGSQRPVYNGQGGAPSGHLQDWLNHHQNAPVQDQERMLRNDPSFNHQAPAEQQREMQQLNRLNQMSAPQRDRRLARNEMLERLSPQERMSVNRSARDWTTLAPDRQAMMTHAFQDLRGVPLDQRDMVLNSARYQGQFSPQERNILSNMLKVEPYEPPQH